MGTHCGEVRYVRQGNYDFDSGTIITYAPGQTIDVTVLPGELPSARGILFTQEFIQKSSLEQNIKNFSFFSYSANEALYVNQQEHELFFSNLNRIQTEISSHNYNFTKNIACLNIELLLNHCSRFYQHQFQTRKEPENNILIKFESLLNQYFNSNHPLLHGLPSVKYFADFVFLSPNCFGDLVKNHTGLTALQYIQNTIINTAKTRLLSSQEPISEIAYNMGFQTSQHFSTFFKKITGSSPLSFRQSKNNS